MGPSGRPSAEGLLAREYGQVRAEVLRTVAAKLAASGIRVPEIDLEAAYNEAWHALYLKLEAGEEVSSRKGLLITITYRRTLSELRASQPGKRTGVEGLERTITNSDLDAQLDAEIQLRQFVEGLRATLSTRELQASILCYLHGFSRAEAAGVMDISRRRMEKVMDAATKKIQSVIERVKAGEHCDDFDSMIRAYAVGLLDTEGERYQLASDHLQGCSACRRKVMILRGIASVAPPFPALIGLAAAAGSAGSDTSGGGSASGPASAASAAGSGASKAGRIAAMSSGVVGVVAVAAAAVAIATAGKGTSSSPAGEPPAGTMSAAVAASGSDDAAARTTKRKETKAKAKAKARRAAAAARLDRAAGGAGVNATGGPVVDAGGAETTPVAPPVPETVVPPPTGPPVVTSPPADPVPPADPAPPAQPQKPVTDAGQEFELR